jgi:denticleless
MIFGKSRTINSNLFNKQEFSAQKSCIYDLEWLTASQLACGGGDQYVSVYDIHTSTRLSLLKGHTESIKSIACVPGNPHVLASGARDGSVLVFDTRCNKYHCSLSDQIFNSDLNTCFIRPTNSIQKAHFTETHPSTTAHHGDKRVLRSKQNIASPSLNSRKPSPLSCVLFQSEHLLISCGATDGLIKVWDTRKIYSLPHSKKAASMDLATPPLHTFDQVNISARTNTTTVQTKKGYTNLILNGTRTHLYSSCMNNYIYEHNMVTYNEAHTRVINKPMNTQANKYHHLNTSNFIKSSLSPCGNFVLSGSSNSNAYIYPVNVNSDMAAFKKHMPIILLKGHTNEVTTVDWNPFDSNQVNSNFF